MTREWVPDSYVDESTPPARETPSDWIVRLPGDGVFALAPCDEEEDPTRILRDGDRVAFMWTETYGRARMTIRGREWSVDRKPPPGTKHICVYGDPESLSLDGLDEFAMAYIDQEPDAAEVTILYYAWSDESTLFEFRAGAFHAIAGAR